MRLPISARRSLTSLAATLALGALAAPVSAAVLNVPSSFATITAAIAAASAGDTISVDSGTYVEDVVVNKSLTVVTTASAIVRSPGATANRTVFSVQAANVTIDGFTVIVTTNTACGISIRGTGTAATRNGAVIQNNNIQYVNQATGQSAVGGTYTAFGANAVGISAFEPTNNGFTCTIQNNTVGTLASPFPQFGIFFDRVQGTVANNTVYGEEFGTEARFFAGPTTFSGNTIIGWGDDGNKGALVDFGDWNATTVTVTNNTIIGQPGASPKLARVHRRAVQLKNLYNSPANIQFTSNTIETPTVGFTIGNGLTAGVVNNTIRATAASALLVEVNNKIYSSGQSNQPLIPTGTLGLAQNNVTITGNSFDANGNTSVTAIEFRDHSQTNQTAAAGPIQFNNIVIGGLGSLANTFLGNLNQFIVLNGEAGTTSGDPKYVSIAAVSIKEPFANDVFADQNLFDAGTGLKRPATMNTTERAALDAKVYDQKDQATCGRVQLDARSVVIAAVSTRGSDNDASKDFVLLANQTAAPVNLANYELRSIDSSLIQRNQALSGSIPANGHFLISSYGTGTNVEGMGTADLEFATGALLANTLSEGTSFSLSLYDVQGGSGGNEVDGFSWGRGAATPITFGELPGFILTTNLAQINSFQRKRPAGTTGLYTDTNNNYNDLQVVPTKTFTRDTAVPVGVSGFRTE